MRLALHSGKLPPDRGWVGGAGLRGRLSPTSHGSAPPRPTFAPPLRERRARRMAVRGAASRTGLRKAGAEAGAEGRRAGRAHRGAGVRGRPGPGFPALAAPPPPHAAGAVRGRGLAAAEAGDAAALGAARGARRGAGESARPAAGERQAAGEPGP